MTTSAITSDPTTGTISTSIRFPLTTHQRAAEYALDENVSLNRFVVAAVNAALDARQDAPVGSGAAASYEAILRFDLPAGDDTDRRAYRVIDEMLNLAELSGATGVKATIKRLAAMTARTANWRR